MLKLKIESLQIISEVQELSTNRKKTESSFKTDSDID